MGILRRIGRYGIMGLYLIVILFAISCEDSTVSNYGFKIDDPNLTIELIAEQPDIATPIGMAIDENDDLFVLESHTHTPMDDYQGPKFDRIKKAMDVDKDGFPEDWMVFADSIEDGMNLVYKKEYGLFLTTKNEVFLYRDDDLDGKSDSRESLVRMLEPNDVYDHAGILGIAMGEEDWLYISRGNVGSKPWTIQGTDGTQIEGYGDGGNIFRCKVDGTRLEEVATGFWNPFDLKFTRDGRLLVTDNDPDSRGPNRLIEVVPGGDYGYKSVYGGSGIHPFSSWNAELPGTLPYAAPLGEAPCALLDAGHTNFGEAYNGSILVNVWEENTVVQVPLKEKGSSLVGNPKPLIQGDRLFHPVALIANSQGDLYISDWVLRQYPNHGKGRIWRVTAKEKGVRRTSSTKINRFKGNSSSTEQLLADLGDSDEFNLAVTRYHLSKTESFKALEVLLADKDTHIRLQALLSLFHYQNTLDKATLVSLLRDTDANVRRMALIYIGKKGLAEMESDLMALLHGNRINTDLFETFLATIRQLQPKFIQGMAERSGRSSAVPRELPKSFIVDILENPGMGGRVKAMVLPYLEDVSAQEDLIIRLLQNTDNSDLQMALLNAIRQMNNTKHGELFQSIAFDTKFASKVRSRALVELMYHPKKYFEEALRVMDENVEELQYAAMKYLCQSRGIPEFEEKVGQWITRRADSMSETVYAAWQFCNAKVGAFQNDGEWYRSIDQNGNPELGELVFNNRIGQCATCHKVGGWGGSFGPDLSKVGSSKSKLQLARAILEPSKEISPEWQGWFLVDERGIRHTGRQIDVKLNGAELMNIQGDFDTFKNPRSFGVMEESLMPEGLENTMTVLEFNHLISYLSELK